jgi:hypothetical protein
VWNKAEGMELLSTYLCYQKHPFVHAKLHQKENLTRIPALGNLGTDHRDQESRLKCCYSAEDHHGVGYCEFSFLRYSTNPLTSLIYTPSLLIHPCFSSRLQINTKTHTHLIQTIPVIPETRYKSPPSLYFISIQALGGSSLVYFHRVLKRIAAYC